MSSLRIAQEKAVSLFQEIERDLIRPGIGDKQLSDEIHALGQERHGIKTHWHKRIVRSGPNTLEPFKASPPDRIIQENDLLIVDLGPVFERWEADFGRTYVLGNDPAKIKLRDALEPIWKKVKGLYDENPTMTGEELYLLAKKTTIEEGWEWGSHLAGHTVGDFPHERIPDDKISFYITAGNHQSLDSIDKNGNKRHWILEIYLQDSTREYMGFFEQLLTA